jgi:valyl-tRNA synthetase
LWNALRLLDGWEIVDTPPSAKNVLANKWFEQKKSAVLKEIESDFEQFRLSEALIKIYSFIWDDFCAWYLEMIKPDFGAPIDKATLQATTNHFQQIMVMLHPFMPFVTEEIYFQLNQMEAKKLGRRGATKDCCVEKYPKAQRVDADFLKKMETAKEAISKIREVRNAKGIKMKDKLEVKLADTGGGQLLLAESGVLEMIVKLANLESLALTSEEVKNSVPFIAATEKFYVVLQEDAIDAEEEREKLSKELDYQRGFLASVEKKLSNERFVQNAKPEIIAAERKKQADAQARVVILEESLANLNPAEAQPVEKKN